MTTRRMPSMMSLVRDDVIRNPLMLVLFSLVLASALAVIYVSHSHREIMNEREQLSSQRDDLDIEWRHLTIEQNALTEHSRVERLAMQQLNMIRPEPKHEVVVPWQ